MRMRTGIILFALGVATTGNGCLSVGPPPIAGSGVSKEETRPVEAFHSIEAGSTLRVVVQITPGATPSLKISGDDNIVPLIESVSHDGILTLRLKENSNISPKLPLLAEVVTGEIDAVDASGAADIKVKGNVKVKRFIATASGAAVVSVEELESPETVATASGASQVMLTGSAGTLKVDASGASQVKAQTLPVEDAEVSISGASSATIRVSKSVTGDVSGASQLDVYGSPAKNSVTNSGASQVIEKK